MTNPITVTIELDLDRHLAGATQYDSDGEILGTGPTTLEDVILDLAARALLDQTAAKTSSDLYGGLRRRITEIRDEVIRDAVAPMVEEALDAAIRPTNAYGEATGEATTLRSIIAKEGVKWLTTGETRDSYGGRSAKTRVQALIETEVNKALTKELSTELAEAKAQVSAAVKAKGAEALAKTITDMARGA